LKGGGFASSDSSLSGDEEGEGAGGMRDQNEPDEGQIDDNDEDLPEYEKKPKKKVGSARYGQCRCTFSLQIPKQDSLESQSVLPLQMSGPLFSQMHRTHQCFHQTHTHCMSKHYEKSFEAWFIFSDELVLRCECSLTNSLCKSQCVSTMWAM
jgi:hypothetical protein